jgi:hypothetical protein
MPLIVPLWAMTWNNTLVLYCECVCFVLFCFTVLPCECSFICHVVWCLLTCSILGCNWWREWVSGMKVYLFIYIPVIGLSNNCSSLTVISTLPYVDYFFHFSMEMKCERVRGIHVIQRYKLLWIFSAKIRIRWGKLQRTNVKTNNFYK